MLLAAIFSTVRKKVQERISYLSLFFLFLSTLSPNPDFLMRSSLRRPTKLNYVFSSTPPLSSPLGNFSILNKNKFRSRVFRAFAGNARSAVGAAGHSPATSFSRNEARTATSSWGYVAERVSESRAVTCI